MGAVSLSWYLHGWLRCDPSLAPWYRYNYNHDLNLQESAKDAPLPEKAERDSHARKEINQELGKPAESSFKRGQGTGSPHRKGTTTL